LGVADRPRNDRTFGWFSHPHMPSDPIGPIRAAVLSATLTLEPRPADPFELRTPAIRRAMPRVTPPLDSEPAYFRYRIDRGGVVQALPAITGARICREKSRRRRSAARS
jgi:hypothetical protein